MPRLTRLLALCLGLCVVPAGFAGEPGAASPPAEAALTPEQNAALAMLDKFLARFDALLAKVQDAKVRTDTQVVLDGLKARRKALGEKFDQGRYDELRLDVNTESQRVAMWLAPLRTPPRDSTAGSK
jgi:hypothetical protein